MRKEIICSLAIAPLGVCKEVGRIDPATGICAGCGGHTLAIGRELAVTRIAPDTALQAIAILHRRSRYISETFPSPGGRNGPDVGHNSKHRQSCEQCSAH